MPGSAGGVGVRVDVGEGEGVAGGSWVGVTEFSGVASGVAGAEQPSSKNNNAQKEKHRRHFFISHARIDAQRASRLLRKAGRRAKCHLPALFVLAADEGFHLFATDIVAILNRRRLEEVR